MIQLNKHNRISAQQPRGRPSWCRGCDAAKTRDGQKCPVCGYKENDRKIEEVKSDRVVWVLSLVNFEKELLRVWVYSSEEKAKRAYTMMFTEHPNGIWILKKHEVIGESAL